MTHGRRPVYDPPIDLLCAKERRKGENGGEKGVCVCKDQRVHPPSLRAATDVDGGLEEPKRSANHVMARNNGNETRRVPSPRGEGTATHRVLQTWKPATGNPFRYTNGTTISGRKSIPERALYNDASRLQIAEIPVTPTL